jgi:hypothetical protein
MLFEPCLNLANWEDVLEAVRSDQRFLGRFSPPQWAPLRWQAGDAI